MPTLNDYQAVLFDVDRTLTNSKDEVSPRLAKALESLTAKGIKIGACTGRSYVALKNYIFPFFPQDSLHIVSGGGQVVTALGEVDWQKSIFASVAKSLVEKLQDTPAEVVVTKKDAIYTTYKMVEYFLEHPWGIPAKPLTELQDYQTPIISVYNLNDQVNTILEEFPHLVVKRMNSEGFGGEYLDITASTTTKAQAFQAWSFLAQIAPGKVIGVGDGQNDIEFLREVGWSVAMGNAHGEVKEVADITIGSTDEDGLAVYLEGLLAGGGVNVTGK